MDFKELQSMIASAEAGANDLAKSLAAAPLAAAGATGGAAAAAAASAAAGAAGAGAGSGNPEDEVDENGNPLVKSFSVTLEDGTVIEAVDASAMMKSFGEQLKVEATGRASDNEQFMKAFGSVIGIANTLTTKLDATNKALEEANAQIAALKSQGETMAKSLNEMGNQGRGRRSADVTVLTRQAAAGAAGNGAQEPTRAEVMAKSLDALNNNVIDGLEASRIEAAINAGRMPEQALLDRIFKQ